MRRRVVADNDGTDAEDNGATPASAEQAAQEVLSACCRVSGGSLDDLAGLHGIKQLLREARSDCQQLFSLCNFAKTSLSSLPMGTCKARVSGLYTKYCTYMQLPVVTTSRVTANCSLDALGTVRRSCCRCASRACASGCGAVRARCCCPAPLVTIPGT